MMEILLITWNYPPRRGGIETMMAALRAGLRVENQLTVLTAHATDRVDDETDVLRAPFPGLCAFAIYAFLRGALELLGRPKLKIVFGGSALTTPLVLLLARVFRRKAVIQVHGLDVAHPNALYRLLCVRWLRCCDLVIANSSYTAALARQSGVHPALISVIPPGVDARRFTPGEASEALKQQLRLAGKRILLFVGRLVERKGVKEFIEYALPQILEKIPEVCFVVVGENAAASLTRQSDALKQIRAAIDASGMQHQVQLIGAVSDHALADFYRACDLVVLPAIVKKNDIEGFGMVLLEAAAVGKPAIATRVGGIPDAIADGHSGVLCAPGDHKSLANAVMALLQDQPRRARMGAVARQRAGAEFAWPVIVKKYEIAFERLFDPIASCLAS